MSKLSKEEKAKVRSFIEFENGLISNSEQLENDLIKFMNKKYIEKYKEKKDYQHIKPMQSFINLDGTEVDRTIPFDNEFIERVSVLLYQESIKDRRSRGIKTKNEPKNIEPIAREDVGIKRQYSPYYQLHGEKVYLSFESSDDYSETSTTQWKIEQIQAQKYLEVEESIDNAINSIFEKYHANSNKNEILYRLLVNLNKETLDYFSYQALVFFINQELNHYHILSNQQRIIDRILLCGELPTQSQKRVLKRALNIKG